MSALALMGTLGALLVLGAVQGATEFLPVSSSGHLVLLGEWMGLGHAEGLTREIALHLGTLVAVTLFCWRDLRSLLSTGSGGLWRLLVGSTIVTGALGLVLKDPIEQRLSTVLGAGCGLLVTSLLLVVVAPSDDARQTRRLEQGTLAQAVVLGLFQTLALMPGISRAGATIVGALVLGFERRHAVRIAFLMSIPVVAGAILLTALDASPEAAAELADPDLLAATALACVVGLVALRFIFVRVDARSLRRFGAYTCVLGLVALGTVLLGGS